MITLATAALAGLMTATTAPGTTRADASACYSIRDQWDRQECVAIQSGSPDSCASLPGDDRRSLCRLRARGWAPARPGATAPYVPGGAWNPRGSGTSR